MIKKVRVVSLYIVIAIGTRGNEEKEGRTRYVLSCVCMCVYMYVCLYVCMYVCTTITCMYVCMYVGMYVCVCSLQDGLI